MREIKLLLTSVETVITTALASEKNLFKIVTPDGSTYSYKSPLKIVAKLFDNAGNQLPPDTEILIYKKRPGDDFPVPIRKFFYSSHYDLTVAAQRDTRFTEEVNVDLTVAGIENPEAHELIVTYRSTATVDLTQSGTTFELVALVSN